MNEEKPRNIDAALAGLSEYWSPRTIAVVNDYDVRVVKVRGEFTQHRHAGTDEFFLVLSGRLTIRTDDGRRDDAEPGARCVVLNPGDVYVVRRGVSHQPCSDVETTLLLIEPSDTVNTGGTPSELTAKRTVA
jgi:mannose-6-phosphate isomerase-like protein (cupin superfamily)